MSQLIDPSSGKLKKLCVGKLIGSFDVQLLINLTSPLSSLKTLVLYVPSSSSLSGLETNTCLTTLVIYSLINLPPCGDIIKIMEQNKTLQKLTTGFFELPKHITELRGIVKVLNENSTLQELKIIASCFMKANYPELTLDPRINYN